MEGAIADAKATVATALKYAAQPNSLTSRSRDYNTLEREVRIALAEEFTAARKKAANAAIKLAHKVGRGPASSMR